MKRFIALFLLMFFASSQAWALPEDDEPLMPDEAFKLKAYAIAPYMIRVEWVITDGYYLYKHGFKFSTKSEDVKLGEPRYPKGKIKDDEFFGKVESYRKKVTIDIPIERSSKVLLDMVLDTESQGCADIGVCYPPQKESKKFSLIPVDDDSVKIEPLKKTGLATLSSLSKNLGLPQQDEFLKADQAFAFGAEVIDGNTILAHWDIADGYYLYRDKFEFSVEDGAGVTLGKIDYPPISKEIEDEVFGKMAVYYHEAAIKIPLKRAVTSPIDMVLRANYQGCADAGFCYPPESQTMGLSLPKGSKGTSEPMAAIAEKAAVPVSEQDGIANSLLNDSIVGIVLSFFGFGLLLAFTPCVFPMVPILSSIIVGQSGEVTTRKALTMSVVYVLAMALTYTVAGIIAGLFGANLQAVFQTPWILISFSLVFVALSFSMFGFYELQLPSSWQSKLTQLSNSQKGGTLVGVAIMGFLSALIVGPCVAAPLMGALIYIGQTGDAVLGGLALFSLSMGMGAPLIVIGASAGKLLPKAGSWMDSVKAVFGVMLLAVAVWMLERVVPSSVALLMWAILLIVSAVYMGAMTQLKFDASGWKKLWKGLGVVMFVYGVLLLVGVASNSSDPLQPLRGVSFAGGTGGSGVAQHQEAEFKKIKSVADLDREVELAAAQGKGVMLDFYADWCVSCKEMERYTFSDAGVISEMSKGVMLQADVTANDDLDKALLKKFKLVGPPSMIFWNKSGEELPHMRMVGFLEADEFAAHVNKAFK
ncbi:MAG: protein-disulfide reductase DsbD [Gammaproteobacteria bacterium]|nr:protein-disulfide reductase DsbD [Gammaproteobacteria bacterium]